MTRGICTRNCYIPRTPHAQNQARGPKPDNGEHGKTQPGQDPMPRLYWVLAGERTRSPPPALPTC